MSHLSLPRVHFHGEFFTNVDTANNDDIVSVVDVAAVTLDTMGMTDGAFRRWMLRQESGNGPRASWNYYGDNTCGFQNTNATRVELPGGAVLITPADDPLIGSDVELNQAVMVDLDPEGILGTQIFCDQFRIRGASGLRCEGPPTRSYSRWLSFRRNLRVGGFTGASAVWQAAIPRDRLTVQASNSPGLAALQTAALAGQGLIVRFCIYLLAARIGQSELAQRYAAGEPVMNPAYGRVIGTVGPWHAGEPTSVSLDRRLHPSARLVDDHIEFQLGPAVAEIDRGRRVVTLDLVTTFPERDATLAKVNVGLVSLRACRGADSVTLGPVSYDRTAYEATAGIHEIGYPSDADAFLDEAQLQLVQDSTGMVVLSEIDPVIETDDRSVYLQQGETQPVRLRVTTKGEAPSQAITLRLEEYVTTNLKGVPDIPAGPHARVVELPDTVTIGTDGSVSVPLQAKQPGTCIIRFVPAQAPARRFNAGLDFFTNVRVLPADDYSQVPNSQITFPFVYAEVLRYYHLLYPSMSLIVDLSDEAAMRAGARDVKARIAQDIWNRAGYMPRTRELSDGKRKLLERWCDLVSPPPIA